MCKEYVVTVHCDVKVLFMEDADNKKDAIEHGQLWIEDMIEQSKHSPSAAAHLRHFCNFNIKGVTAKEKQL